MTTLKNKYTFIDLFSGCGGLSEGFLSSGNYEGLAHVEWELPMVETLRNRLEKKWKHLKFNTEIRSHKIMIKCISTNNCLRRGRKSLCLINQTS